MKIESGAKQEKRRKSNFSLLYYPRIEIYGHWNVRSVWDSQKQQVKLWNLLWISTEGGDEDEANVSFYAVHEFSSIFLSLLLLFSMMRPRRVKVNQHIQHQPRPSVPSENLFSLETASHTHLHSAVNCNFTRVRYQIDVSNGRKSTTIRIM